MPFCRIFPGFYPDHLIIRSSIFQRSVTGGTVPLSHSSVTFWTFFGLFECRPRWNLVNANFRGLRGEMHGAFRMLAPREFKVCQFPRVARRDAWGFSHVRPAGDFNKCQFARVARRNVTGGLSPLSHFAVNISCNREPSP